VHVPQVHRKHVRAPFHGHVVCDTEHEEFTALAETLSEGGLGLLVSGDVTMDTEWVVTFSLPGSKDVIEAKGRVRRTSETQVGLSFAKIHETDRESIRQYVASQQQ
jgi:c-di-GMP-binding flagellar brake protein YcgR